MLMIVKNNLLNFKDAYIYQDTDYFKFSLDSLLLANFVTINLRDKNILDIAEENKDKSFVYVYDNFFNHMQSVSEMMIYNRTLIVNVNNNDELHCVIDDDSLNNEDSYILSIKSYMDNDAILNRIKEESEFKNISLLYKSEIGPNSEVVMDNIYLVSK